MRDCRGTLAAVALDGNRLSARCLTNAVAPLPRALPHRYASTLFVWEGATLKHKKPASRNASLDYPVIHGDQPGTSLCRSVFAIALRVISVSSPKRTFNITITASTSDRYCELYPSVEKRD